MTAPQPSPPEEPARQGASPLVRGWTLAITNIGKLIGFGIAVNEAVLRTEARNSVIMMCVVFVLGTQAVEVFLLRVLDQVFGGSSR